LISLSSVSSDKCTAPLKPTTPESLLEASANWVWLFSCYNWGKRIDVLSVATQIS
jgi:hypothetical protein